ncbi:sperm associated antigen 1 [Phyllostomus discolor]|uniref:Sperm associated antigen 1 n=1 Tax=Phyllostomus discolor TaxID=89673 RepID=A0A833ZYM3_9CHIR|nr:sperm associated antigen 1 [Phyllostomus discolor]
MAAKDHPSLWGFGTTKTFKIPIEHLDFKYIEKCSDVKHLEKILCVLRSGEEGYYPELTEFCEKRLKALAPQSRALRKDKPAATASSFTAGEWEKIDGDIKFVGVKESHVVGQLTPELFHPVKQKLCVHRTAALHPCPLRLETAILLSVSIFLSDLNT